MTNLKFRVWLKKHKQMYDVDAISFSKEMIQIVNEEFKELVFDFNEVKILQSTGLKDKNGKEIFEGDIVKFKFGRGFAQSNIIFSSGSFYVENYHRLSYWEIQKSEIIGNKYENPELLNK